VPTNFYDVIALGDDLAGLIAATLCARRGLRVLVARTPQSPSEDYRLGPYKLSREPMPLVGESSPALRRVIGELNFMQTVKRRSVPLRPAFQIVLPDARLDFGPDGEAVGRELARELPGQAAQLVAAFDLAGEVSRVLEPVLGQDVSLPPDGFWERRELARSEPRLPTEEDLLPDVPAGHPARALLMLPGALTLGVDPRAMSTASALRAFDLWRRGTAWLDGGAETLREMLLEKMRTQHAGELRTVVPGGVTTSWGKVSGVSLRDLDETLGAAYLLVGQPLAEFGDLFGEKRPKRIFEVQKAIQPTAYRYVLNLVVSEAGVPEGMGHAVFVVVDPAKPLIGDNAFAIYRGEADNEARVTLSVVANCPAPGDGENLEDLMTALRYRLRSRLEDVMPFYAEHLLCVHSPNQARAPEGLEAREAPAAIPPRPLWSSSLPASLGVGGCGYDAGVRNAFTASSQNLPGLGLEGDFAAGWCAARLVSQAAGKKKDYLKDEVLLSGGG
jgi:hypothetical protein